MIVRSRVTDLKISYSGGMSKLEAVDRLIVISDDTHMRAFTE
jgi:hypothetical protein